ncbi:hypothetical protein [Nostoc sp.]|uniref:hypothetical protein n=1 Tax=Nostoc sp. TaxID=1180 RepID=UPI002FF46213
MRKRKAACRQAMSTTGCDARSPLASPLLYETLREGRRLANAPLSVTLFINNSAIAHADAASFKSKA